MRTKQARVPVRRNGNTQVAVYLVIFIAAMLVLLPIFTMVATSLKTNHESQISTRFFPEKISFENYGLVISRSNFLMNMGNSAVVAVLLTVATIALSSLAGYALSRFKGRFFSIFSTVLLMLYIFPKMLALIPLFTIFVKLRLIDTKLALIASYLTVSLPFSIWMIKGFFDSVPWELEEAAMIEGVSQFGSFVRIILPLSTPGLAAVGIYAFIYAWKEFMQASIILRKDAGKTISVGLYVFVQQFNIDWGSMLAAATMASVPIALFLIFAQKYIVQGLTAGAVKG